MRHGGAMKLDFVTVDVFTDRQFGGNPLAVVPDARGLTSAQMQAVAAEFNLSETTFVLPTQDAAKFAFLRLAPSCRLPAIRTSAPPSCSPAPRPAPRGPSRAIL